MTLFEWKEGKTGWGVNGESHIRTSVPLYRLPQTFVVDTSNTLLPSSLSRSKNLKNLRTYLCLFFLDLPFQFFGNCEYRLDRCSIRVFGILCSVFLFGGYQCFANHSLSSSQVTPYDTWIFVLLGILSVIPK